MAKKSVQKGKENVKWTLIVGVSISMHKNLLIIFSFLTNILLAFSNTNSVELPRKFTQRTRILELFPLIQYFTTDLSENSFSQRFWNCILVSINFQTWITFLNWWQSRISFNFNSRIWVWNLEKCCFNHKNIFEWITADMLFV